MSTLITVQDAKIIFGMHELVPLFDKIHNEREHAKNQNNYELALQKTEEGHIIANKIDYTDYVMSDWFNFLKNQSLIYNPSCAMCSRQASTIHHNKYSKILFKEVVNVDVKSVCNQCHEIFHEKNKVISAKELREISNSKDLNNLGGYNV